MADAAGAAGAAHAASAAWGGVSFDGKVGAGAGGADGEVRTGYKRSRANTQGDTLLRSQVAALQANQQSQASTASTAQPTGKATAKTAAAKGQANKASAASAAAADGAANENGHGEQSVASTARQRKRERLGLLSAQRNLHSLQLVKALQAHIMITFVSPSNTELMSYIRQCLREYHSKIFKNSGHNFGTADTYVWKLHCLA